VAAVTTLIIMVGLGLIFKYAPPRIYIHHTHQVIPTESTTPTLSQSSDSGDSVYGEAIITVASALQEFQGGVLK
jgi:hypothetical protein